MNKASLVSLGLIDEDLQCAILKMHNKEINAYKNSVRRLTPYKLAVQKFHNGYDPTNDVPEPADPETALDQVMTGVANFVKAGLLKDSKKEEGS